MENIPFNTEIPELTVQNAQVLIENFDMEDKLAQCLMKDYKQPQGFDKIGFARPLGGFFYQFFYALIGGVLILITYTQILRVLYPYPDAKGYTTVGNMLFSLLFLIMNIPTAFSLERFVAEWAVKHPGKMIQYIRFYVWYQMLTGVLLVTITSIYVLYILETGSLVYTKWLLLIYISREYPAMTGVFQSSLRGLQQFQFESKVGFYAQTFIQPTFEVLCVLWGRFVLGANPMIGEMMGIAIGYAIGTYIDDFITMGISMRYLNRVLKTFGYTIKDVIVPKVDRDVWTSSLKFGLQLSPPQILSAVVGFATFFWWYDFVPAYATLLVLNETADQLANFLKRGGGIYLKPTISESLNNKKKELSHFYIAMSFKFAFISIFGVGVILYAFMPIILEMFLTDTGIENWLLAVAFITPNIIATTIEGPSNIVNDVILGGNRPSWYSFTEILKTVLNFGIDILLLFVLEWPQEMGLEGLIWLLPLKAMPINLLIFFLNIGYINRNLVKIRFRQFAWQTWGAPILAAGGVALVAFSWFAWVYPPLHTSTGVYPTAAITLIVGFLCLLWVFFPLYTAFGGWDNYNINVFHEAVEISGPSRFLFRPIDIANRLLVRSPLHNRFAIPWEQADKEADELMKIQFVKKKLNNFLKANA